MELLSVREAAAQLHVSPKYMYVMLSRRQAPSIRIGRHIFVPRPAFDAWCGEQVQKAIASMRVSQEQVKEEKAAS
jgi:excisionase family DNA binding protein